MYNFFCRNLKNYMSSCGGEQDYRSQISQVFEGLLDQSTYQKWKAENHPFYKELNNLVYRIQKEGEISPLFETLGRDLWACDYLAAEDPAFNTETIEEQLKIINLCLRGQYLE
ncbi:MAG: hypothetical protein E7231_03235 [Cellulosilyticum sp.]|nr:hypothetical protein [Cellulosilyticum sp.]